MANDQVDSLNFVADVDDQASGPAKAAADALKNLGTQADAASAGLDSVDKSGTAATSTVSTRLLPSMTQLNRVLDDNAAQTAKLAAVEAQRQRYLDALTQSQGAATTAGLSYEQAQAKINDRFDTQVAKVLGVTTATTAASEAVKVATKATEDASAASETHAGILNNVANAFGVQKYAVVEATDELHKFADQVLAGGSALTASFYQLPNIGQALGGFGNIAKVAAGFLIGPAGLALGAVAAGAGLIALGVAAESQESRLAQLSVQLRATRTDAASMADEITAASKAIAAQPGFNQATGRQAAVAIGSTYDFQGSSADIQALAVTAQNLGTVLGTGLKGGLDAVTTALVNPTAEIDALAKQHFPGVNAAMVETVTRLQAAGQQGQAFATVMGAVHDASQNARVDALTPWQKAIEGFTDSVKPAVEQTKSLASVIGTGLLNTATGFLNVLQHGGTSESGGLGSSSPLLGPAIAGSSERATGIFQVLPSTGASLGYDVTDYNQNIKAGLSYIHQLYSSGSTAGSFDKVAAQYGGYGSNVSAASGYISKVDSASSLSLPVGVSGQILYWGRVLGLSDQEIGFGQKMAMVESGGHQFSTSASSTDDPSDLFGSAGGTAINFASMVSNKAAVTGGATTAAGGYSSTSYTAQAAAIQAYIDGQKQLQVSQAAGSAEWTETQQKIDAATGALRNAKSGQALLTQSLQDSEAPLQAATGYQRTMAEVTKQFTLEAQKSAGGVVDLTALHGALSVKQQELATAYQDGTVAIERQTAAGAGLTPLYEQGAAAVAHATAVQQANTAAGDDFDKKTPAFKAAVQARIDALDAANNQKVEQSIAQQNGSLQDQIAYLDAETNSLGLSSQARAVYLAQVQASTAAHRSETGALGDEANKNIALAGTLAANTAAYQQQQQALSDLSSGVSGVFSTLGNDITQAFTQGSGSAVSFKTVLAGLETQLVSLILKFAVINPLMNELFGGNATTLSGIAGALGSTSLSSGSIGGGGSLLGTLGTAGSLASSASGGGLLSSLGLGGLGSSVGGFLSTPVGFLGGQANPWASISLTGQTTVGPTIGGLLGGAGLGFGAGELLGGLTGHTGTGNTLGSAGGALAGAAIGSIVPGIGTLIGGLIGGAGGGLLGGLFGGHKKNPYTLDTVGTSGGQLSISSIYNQAETDQVTAQLQSDISSLNATFKSLGLTVSAGNGNAQGSLGIVGDGAKNASSSIASYLGAIRFGGATGTFNTALQSGVNGGFSTADLSSVSSFQAAIQALKTMADAVDQLHVRVSALNADAGTVTVGGGGSFSGHSAASSSALDYALDGKTLSTSDLSSQISTITAFVDTTLPGLLSATVDGTSSFQQQITSVTASYTSAEAEASTLGIGTDKLSAKLQSLTASMYAAAQQTLDNQTAGYQARDLTATGNTEGAALLNQSTQAAQELAAFNQSWQAIYGDAYTAAAGYGSALAQLQKTQGDERLEIEQQYQEQQTAVTTAALAATHSAWEGALTGAYNAQAALSDDGTTQGKITSLGYSKNGALQAFDDQRASTLAAFQKTFTDEGGSQILGTSGYAAALGQEETTLGLQRLAIVKQYSDQITAVEQQAAQVQAQAVSSAQQSATASVTSLASYARSLATSSTSPLSAADQYAAAKSNEQSTAAAARVGDPTALGNLQGVLQTFLTISQSYNGGGLGFANDFSAVQGVLSDVGSLSSDTLTASFFAQQSETSTQTIVDSLADLRTEVVKLQQITRTNALVSMAA